MVTEVLLYASTVRGSVEDRVTNETEFLSSKNLKALEKERKMYTANTEEGNESTSEELGKYQRAVILSGGIRECFLKEVAFEQRPDNA